MAAAVATLDAATWGESWGFGLYQSDSDLELLDHIAEEASTMFPKSALDCLRCPLFPAHFTLRAPMDKLAVIAYLNEGIFQRLARRLNHQGNPLALIMLAAVGMELGVVIDKEDMLMIKMTVMKMEMFLEKRNQLVEALEGYRNNGIPWHFRNKDGKGAGTDFNEMEKQLQSREVTNRGVMKPQAKNVISREMQMPSPEVENSGVRKLPVKDEKEKRAIRKPQLKDVISEDVISAEEIVRVEAAIEAIQLSPGLRRPNSAPSIRSNYTASAAAAATETTSPIPIKPRTTPQKLPQAPPHHHEPSPLKNELPQSSSSPTTPKQHSRPTPPRPSTSHSHNPPTRAAPPVPPLPRRNPQQSAYGPPPKPPPTGPLPPLPPSARPHQPHQPSQIPQFHRPLPQPQTAHNPQPQTEKPTEIPQIPQAQQPQIPRLQPRPTLLKSQIPQPQHPRELQIPDFAIPVRGSSRPAMMPNEPESVYELPATEPAVGTGAGAGAKGRMGRIGGWKKGGKE